MIATDTFVKFGRRIASTQGCPYVFIADTPNPIQDLGQDELRKRAEAMLSAVIDGLTLPTAEIERRLKDHVKQQIRPQGIVRSSLPV
jgi:hypothetical protein